MSAEYDGPDFAPDDGSAPQPERAADVPHPLVLRYAGLGTTWLRTPDDRWVIVDDRTIRAEVEALWPSVPLWTRSKDGKATKVTPAQLQEIYGRRVDTVIYDLTTDRHVYHPAPGDLGGELVLSCARIDATIEPRRDVDCEVWLERLAGPQIGVLLDWIATMTDLSRPTSALYLYGAASAGKGLFASACARQWGRSVTSYAKVCGRFNSSMRDCPVILLDEGQAMDPNGSASFRSLVGERSHAIEDKGRPVSTLLGCIRLVIAANNRDALRIREDLTSQDEGAIGKRITMIEIPRGMSGQPDSSAAGEFLASCAHHHWVDDGHRPGRLVRHFAWLQETREVKTGTRFLVEGDISAWIKGAARRGGLQQEALIAIARLASGAVADLSEDRVPVWWAQEEAYVSVDRLQQVWQTVMPGGKPPTVTALSQAVARVAPDRLRITVGCARPWVRRVPAQAIIDAADAAGIGSSEDLRHLFGLPDEG